MEPKTNNQNINNVSQNIASNSEGVNQVPVQPKQGIMQNIFNILNKIIKTLIESWMKLNPAIRKVVTIAGFIFGILIVLALIFSLSTRSGSKAKPTPTPRVSSQDSPLPEVLINPSRYATDSAVLSIEEKLKVIEKDINGTLINDLKLSPPNLLWDVNFEE